jgi:hypothetical protein
MDLLANDGLQFMGGKGSNLLNLKQLLSDKITPLRIPIILIVGKDLVKDDKKDVEDMANFISSARRKAGNA